MNKFKILFILINFSFYSCISQQNEQSLLLKGTPISDSSSELALNAFDGDITTEFKSSNSKYSWIGLELDSSYIP